MKKRKKDMYVERVGCMKTIKQKSKMKRQKVTFYFESTEVNQIYLSGDFNNWSIKAHPMKNDGNGKWERTIMIPPGKYEYKFLVDGQWLEDPKNDQCCVNIFGTNNSVIRLKPK